jgi:nucleoside-diphosphate-sugar epimerase/SAM-dependent methyltransferase
MRVLVTGHEGYLGAVLVPALRARGHQVVGLDIGYFNGCDFTPSQKPPPALAMDLRDIEALRLDERDGIDAVVHLAALSNDALGEIDPARTHEINYLASVALAEKAKRAGVKRFLFSSSCSIYGASDDTLTERSPLRPLTAYARSKVETEEALDRLADPGFSPVILRNATAYGVSPRLRIDIVLNNLVGWAHTTGKIRLLSDGSAFRPLVHVADIAAAFVAALEAPSDAVHNQALNIGRDEDNYRIRDLAELVGEIVPGSQVEVANQAQADHRNYRVDFSKAARALPAFRPQWNARRGAEQLHRAYRDYGLTLAHMREPRYVRLARLASLMEADALDPGLRWRPARPAPAQMPSPASAPRAAAQPFACRSCGAEPCTEILDMGATPLANRLLEGHELGAAEPWYPLALVFCPRCTLAQITETVPPEVLFREYVYCSSFSDALVAHAEGLARRLIEERGLDGRSLVLEIASNDGYLLQHYRRAGIATLGIDPARNVAEIARRERGIPTLDQLFSRSLAEELCRSGHRPAVLHAHNVLAHVADPNDFVAGMALLLPDDGVAVIEVPYVRDLVDHVELDTIYHEHLSYFSVTALAALLGRHELAIAGIERLPIHGGSLRLFVTRPAPGAARGHGPSVRALLAEEAALGLTQAAYYADFGGRARALRDALVDLLDDLRRRGHSIAAYGASAKGSTLLNVFGIGRDHLDFVVDRSTLKQGRFMPGTHLPIHGPERLLEAMPDYTLLLTWNFADEILAQQAEYRRRGGRFIVPLPTLTVR